MNLENQHAEIVVDWVSKGLKVPGFEAEILKGLPVVRGPNGYMVIYDSYDPHSFQRLYENRSRNLMTNNYVGRALEFQSGKTLQQMVPSTSLVKQHSKLLNSEQYTFEWFTGSPNWCKLVPWLRDHYSYHKTPDTNLLTSYEALVCRIFDKEALHCWVTNDKKKVQGVSVCAIIEHPTNGSKGLSGLFYCWSRSIVGIKFEDHPYMYDKNSAFYRAASLACSQALGSLTTVESPFINMTKTDMIRWAVKEGLDSYLSKTVSCYDDTKFRCGGCGLCFKRAIAMEAAGRSEIDEYEVNPFTGKQAEHYRKEYKAALESGDFSHYERERIEETLSIIGR